MTTKNHRPRNSLNNADNHRESAEVSIANSIKSNREQTRGTERTNVCRASNRRSSHGQATFRVCLWVSKLRRSMFCSPSKEGGRWNGCSTELLSVRNRFGCPKTSAITTAATRRPAEDHWVAAPPPPKRASAEDAKNSWEKAETHISRKKTECYLVTNDPLIGAALTKSHKGTTTKWARILNPTKGTFASMLSYNRGNMVAVFMIRF